MYPHRIRLRGPWEYEILEANPHCQQAPQGRVILANSLADMGFPGFSGKIRLVRKFGYPGRIDAFERVWLTMMGLKGLAQVVLNETILGENRNGDLAFDATKLLQERNQLKVLLDADSDQCGLTGEVALEIRCAIFLGEVNIFLVKDGDLVIEGRLQGEWPEPLDLYILIDKAHVHYASLRATKEGETFRALIPREQASGKTVRVDLGQGAHLWDRRDLPNPVCTITP